jgi:orotidine-5'-phosphate decarboxylase
MAGELIVALDLDTRAEAETLIERLGDSVGFYKIGYQLFYGGDGFALGRALLAAGKRVFFDLKLLDIDNTVEKGVARHRQTGATMLTVHAYPKTMRAAAGPRRARPHRARRHGADLDGRRRRRRCRLCARRGGPRSAAGRAGQGRGDRRLVCSPNEAAMVRAIVGPKLAIVTPGVRPAGSAVGDQKRVMTPADALAAGATISSSAVRSPRRPIRWQRRTGHSRRDGGRAAGGVAAHSFQPRDIG